MQDEVEDRIEQVLNVIVCTLEQSSNMRKAMKQNLLETASTLKLLFVRIKVSWDKKTSEMNNVTEQVAKLGIQMKRCRNIQQK